MQKGEEFGFTVKGIQCPFQNARGSDKYVAGASITGLSKIELQPDVKGRKIFSASKITRGDE